MQGCVDGFPRNTNSSSHSSPPHPPHLHSFRLPSPLLRWPPGGGFSKGKIDLGEIEVYKITDFELICELNLSHGRKRGVSFYKPAVIPSGFFCLGHYCQSNDRPLRGFVLLARDIGSSEVTSDDYRQEPENKSPALQKPLDFTLVWTSNVELESEDEHCGYFWLPQAPDGYKPLGYLVTNKSAKPGLDEVRVVRSDLTDACEKYRLLFDRDLKSHGLAFKVWSVRPHHRGMHGKGVSVGSFFCDYGSNFNEGQCSSCLRNLDLSMCAMPDLDQVHSLIHHYGPTVFFHPDEEYLPSSVSWFFDAGALLYKKGEILGENIDANGSNLPLGGTNNGEYWIDLPSNSRNGDIKHGNLDSAIVYVHVKPALGGTFTDIAMWIFCPFNGPATLKLGIIDFSLGKIGQQVGDWEHFTLRISNFSGELWSIYFSQHSGGQWVDIYDLGFIEENKAIIYSSKGGHASFPHPGTFIQGSQKFRIGIRNDAACSKLKLDSSVRYEIVAAEYLGKGAVIEPFWLNYMRKWGPTVAYGFWTRLDEVLNKLPSMLRGKTKNVLGKLPLELHREEGPTGPKEKNNWEGDERS